MSHYRTHLAALLLAALTAASLIAQPAKEYIRLGGRVIAIESPAILVPDFSLQVGSAALSVIAGNQVGNQISIGAINNFNSPVTFSLAGTPAGTVPSFTPASVTGAGSATLSLSVPANATPGAYLVTVTGASGALNRSASFTLNVSAGSPAPQSAVFGPAQYLTGSSPSSFNSLTNWRFETRLHLTSSLAIGASRVVMFGTTRLGIYRYSDYNGQLSLAVILQDGVNTAEFWTDATDLFVRAQRTGSSMSIKGWKVLADGSLSPLPEDTKSYSASATLSPGFGLGAASEEDAPINGRYPLNGQMAFFRFFDTNASNSVTPNLCDTSTALVRYEFESNLTPAGASSASLTPTGNIAYQPTPASSCSVGGAPPAFSLVPGAQSPHPVVQGQSATYSISINRQNYNGVVTLTGCTGPAGVSCPTVNATGLSATVTVNTTAATPVTPATPHTVTLQATGTGGLTASASLALTVASPAPTFTLSVNPNVVTFNPTGTQNLTATVNPAQGFTGNVNFTCAAAPGQSLPASLSCVAPNPASHSDPQRTFTVTAATGAPQGTYTLRLTGTGPAAQTAFKDFQVTVLAAGIRAFIFPESREISTSPGAYYQFLSTVEGSEDERVNWNLSPLSGGLTAVHPPTGSGAQTAGPTSYVYFRPPASLPGGAATQSVALTGTPNVGGQPGAASLLLRSAPYGPPLVCRPFTVNPAGCLDPSESYTPATLSATGGLSWLRLESHYAGTWSYWSDARLHRTLVLAFPLNPETPWDTGVNACVIRIQRSLAIGGPDGQTMYLDGGPSPTSASIGPGAPNSTVTNGVCTVNRLYTNLSTNYAADPTKGLLDVYVRFNQPSAPRYVFYKIDTFNDTSSGTVLVRPDPLPVSQ